MEKENFIEDMQQVHEKKKLSYKEMEKTLKEYKESLELATQTIKNQITENKENYDKYLRALADYQNLQRNTAITISKSKDTGKIAIFKDLLPILDDFEKAKEAGEVNGGIELIYNKLLGILSSNGIEEINPQKGDKFDDNIHEAIMAVPSEDEEKGTIYFTQFKGYKMGDNIIRYAKVGVNV